MHKAAVSTSSDRRACQKVRSVETGEANRGSTTQRCPCPRTAKHNHRSISHDRAWTRSLGSALEGTTSLVHARFPTPPGGAGVPDSSGIERERGTRSSCTELPPEVRCEMAERHPCKRDHGSPHGASGPHPGPAPDSIAHDAFRADALEGRKCWPENESEGTSSTSCP